MKKILILIAFLSILGSCNLNSKKNRESQDSIQKIDSKSELEKWKKELLDKKLVGTPCGNPELDKNRAKWASENDNEVVNGLPSNEKEYQIVYSDFNNDKKEDLLMFFESHNCSGHNGHVSQNFARIVYSDGTMVSDLASEIYAAILKEYNIRREKDKTLKEVDDAYQKSDTNIETYKDGTLSGIFALYDLNDGHCCPSYQGKYTYSITNKTASLTFNTKSN